MEVRAGLSDSMRETGFGGCPLTPTVWGNVKCTDRVGGVCYISFSLSSFYQLSQHSDSTPDVTSLCTNYSSTCYTFRIYTYFQFQVFF